MTAVHFAVPDSVDAPQRVSGGNVYDRRVRDGLAADGWDVRTALVPEGADALAAALAAIPDGALVLVDGLLVAREPAALTAEAGRLRGVILAHLVDGAIGDDERTAYRSVRHVVATSGWTRAELTEQDVAEPGAVSVAHPGADAAPATVPSPAGGRLLCVGALARHKGQDLLVDALAAFASDPGWSCVLAGSLAVDPAFVAAVRARIVAAGLADRVALPGVLGGTALADAYGNADLVVQPSRLESYGMAVADALAHAVPVLATCVGGLPEAIGSEEAAMVVPPDDSWAIRVVLQQWWGSAERRSALREAALRAQRSRRSWEATVEAVADVLRGGGRRARVAGLGGGIMSDVIEVSHDWLALREAEDGRARSLDLARALTEILPTGPLMVHDLGSGTGSMMRWLAPLLPGPQTWVLHDWNASLTARALDGPRPHDLHGRAVDIRTRVDELDRLDAATLSGASLVTASALLDVLTAQEAHAIVDACVGAGSPALLSLSVTGDVDLHPRDSRDRRVAEAFNAHQRRSVQGRALLGRFGAPIVQGLFELAGWNVRRALTTWRLSDAEPQLLAEWFDGWLGAAEEQSPDLATRLGDYRERRVAQEGRGDLSATIYHLDLLAWPR